MSSSLKQQYTVLYVNGYKAALNMHKNKHPLRRNAEVNGCMSQTDSKDSDTVALRVRQLYLPISVLTVNSGTCIHIGIYVIQQRSRIVYGKIR